MNALQTFQYQEHQIRTIQRNGEPWFVLRDVCQTLNLSTPSRVADRLDEDEKGVSLIHTPGGPQEVAVISESGLYAVILRSDKQEAKPFRRWVTHEVLPSIRKTGIYSTQSRPPEVSPNGLAKLISITRRTILDVGGSPEEVCEMVRSIYQTWKIPVPAALSRQISGQVSLFDTPRLGA